MPSVEAAHYQAKLNAYPRQPIETTHILVIAIYWLQLNVGLCPAAYTPYAVSLQIA